MPIFSKGDKSIFYIHIPKTGGSSVEKIGRNMGWSESFSIRGKSLSEISYCKASFQHLHMDLLDKLFDLDSFDTVFTIVRNPFSRFKSEYYWQRSKLITKLGVKDWVDDTLSRYPENNYLYDNHIRPQVEFVEKYPRVQVIKLESGGIKQAREIFLQLYPCSNRCERLRKYFQFFLAVDSLEKNTKKDPAVEEEFNNCYDRIVSFYIEDFDAFSYEK